jgi:Tfp pilus assembly protein PilO
VPEKIMLRIISKRERIILYLTTGVILFSLVFNFLISPLLKRQGSLNKEINITRLRLKKYLRLLNQEDEIKNKYNKFASGKNLTNETQDAAVSALSALETLARDSGIRIIDVRPQSAKAVDLYKEIFIDLRTEGAIEGYLKFLYNVENSLTLLRIKRFQLNAKPNSQLLDGSFSVSQLSLPE